MNVKLELYGTGLAAGQATETVLSTGTYASITEAHQAAIHGIRLWRVPVRWRIRDFDSGRILGEGDPAPVVPSALEHFVVIQDEIADVLNRLASLCDDHFGVVPDDVTWADVGSLNRYKCDIEAIVGNLRMDMLAKAHESAKHAKASRREAWAPEVDSVPIPDDFPEVSAPDPDRERI
jgi:hypothetical protein